MRILLPDEAYTRLKDLAKVRRMSTKEFSALVLVDYILRTK